MAQRLVGVTGTVHLALSSVAVIIAACMRQRHVSVCMHSAGHCQCTCHDMHKTVAVTCKAVQIGEPDRCWCTLCAPSTCYHYSRTASIGFVDRGAAQMHRHA